MKTLVVILALFLADVAFSKHVFEFEQLKDDGKHWAFLVAGSNGYFNYRHQADVCHAYQIMKSHGIPDEQIIVMMYDDIAYNSENPVFGNIINKPDGPNVYPGVPKDYVKEDVNPEKFISVLKGEKDVNGGKVIDSGPNDHIFVNFVDHGAPGIIAFVNKMLKASTLNTAIQDMYNNKRFAKMVFYVEACESGSMFENLLPKDINVFATTAANSHESSYACYFDKKRRTYLGDVYSVKWMEDSDKEDLKTETLQKQFSITKDETSTSHVMEFGDMTMGKMTVAEFQGTQDAKRQSNPATPCKDAVPSEDVPLESVRRSMSYAENDDDLLTLQLQEQEILEMRAQVDRTIKQIVSEAVADHRLATDILQKKHHVITKWSCYENIVEHVAEACQEMLDIPENDYALRKLYTFVNMCEEGVPYEVMESVVNKVCQAEN